LKLRAPGKAKSLDGSCGESPADAEIFSGGYQPKRKFPGEKLKKGGLL
jgi:hypothetical protein